MEFFFFFEYIFIFWRATKFGALLSGEIIYLNEKEKNKFPLFNFKMSEMFGKRMSRPCLVGVSV
jgi:hypothetical protein